MKLSAAFVAAALAASRVHARPVADNVGDNDLVVRSNAQIVGAATLQAAKRGTDVDLVTRSSDHDGQPLDHLLTRDSDIVQRNELTEILESVRWKLGSWWRNKEPGPYMKSLYAEDALTKLKQPGNSHAAHSPKTVDLSQAKLDQHHASHFDTPLSPELMELRQASLQSDSEALDVEIAKENEELVALQKEAGLDKLKPGPESIYTAGKKMELENLYAKRKTLDAEMRKAGLEVPERAEPKHIEIIKFRPRFATSPRFAPMLHFG